MSSLLDLSTVQNLSLMGGIALAIAGAALMSFGAHYQHRGVVFATASGAHVHSDSPSGLSFRKLLQSRVWCIGTALLGCAVIAQIAAIALAPIAVVQPLGVLALVISTLLHSHAHRVRISGTTLGALTLCVAGVGVFVTVAAAFASTKPAAGQHSLALSAMLATVLTLALVTSRLLRRKAGKPNVLYFITAAGVIYGIVVTLAKSIISTFQNGSVDGSTALHLAALLAGTITGGYFVQAAYAVGRPHVVVAGLTVIDPAVAVAIGLYFLGEGIGLPLGASGVFLTSGACAIYGVVLLSRHRHAPIPADQSQLGAATEAMHLSVDSPPLVRRELGQHHR